MGKIKNIGVVIVFIIIFLVCLYSLFLPQTPKSSFYTFGRCVAWFYMHGSLLMILSEFKVGKNFLSRIWLDIFVLGGSFITFLSSMYIFITGYSWGLFHNSYLQSDEDYIIEIILFILSIAVFFGYVYLRQDLNGIDCDE